MDISFSLGGMQFEYDEEKNQANIRKHGISFRSALVFSSIMTESNYSMKRTVSMKNVLIQLETPLLE